MPVRGELEPGGVDGEDPGWESAEASVFAGADAVFDAGVGAVTGLRELDRAAGGTARRVSVAITW